MTIQGLQFEGVGTLELQKFKIKITCQNCKNDFDITLSLLSLKEQLLNFNKKCPKCARSLGAVLNYQNMHMENKEDAGMLALQAVLFKEVKKFQFGFNCVNCDKTYITQGVDPKKEYTEINCLDCYKKLKVVIHSVDMQKIETVSLSSQSSKKSKKKTK